MLRLGHNVGRGPGVESDTQWGSGHGGYILVEMALRSDLGKGGRSMKVVAGELLLNAAPKTLDSGMKQLCLTPSLTPPNEM